MNSTQRVLLLFLIVCLIFIPISNYQVTIQGKYNPSKTRSIKIESNLAYINHSSIYISNDVGLEVFPGNGTELNPYRIENFNINTSSEYGIYITNVSKHFLIQNCYISAGNWSIHLYRIADDIASIFNNTCSESFNGGISIWLSDGVSIQNNNCSYSGGEQYEAGMGIYGYWSNNIVLKNNYCNFNNHSGINLFYCDYSIVENNTCSGSGYSFIYDSIHTSGGSGLRISCCYKSEIRNNTFLDNPAGMSMRYMQDSLVLNNTYKENNRGFYIFECTYSSIFNNTFLYNSLGIRISDSSSLVIERNNFSHNLETGLYIKNSNWFIINNNTLKQNNIGIEFENCRGNSITNNSIISSSSYGVILSGYDNKVYGNWFIENAMRTEFSSQAFDSGENNSWYSTDKEFGNYWSDLGSRCSYQIDGPSESVDIFPLNVQSECDYYWLSQIQKTIVIVLSSIIGIFSMSYIVLSILRKRFLE